MAPEWASFPERVTDGQTSFLCELDRGEQEEQILDHLANFDGSLILFCKKLGRVDIEVLRDNGQHCTKSVTRRETKNSDHHISVLRNGNDELLPQKYFPCDGPAKRAQTTRQLVV